MSEAVDTKPTETITPVVDATPAAVVEEVPKVEEAPKATETENTTAPVAEEIAATEEAKPEETLAKEAKPKVGYLTKIFGIKQKVAKTVEKVEKKVKAPKSPKSPTKTKEKVEDAPAPDPAPVVEESQAPAVAGPVKEIEAPAVATVVPAATTETPAATKEAIKGVSRHLIPPMVSHMPYHGRRVAEELRAAAEQILWERARWDHEFAYRIRMDPVYYRTKLREQIYAVENNRRRSSVPTVRFAPSIMPATTVIYR